MNKKTKKILLTLAIFGAGVSLGLTVPKGQTAQEKDFQTEITSLKHESKRIESLKHYKELPETYQEEQLKKLDKFVNDHKNLTKNERYTIEGLTYENSDAYQDFWFTEH